MILGGGAVMVVSTLLKWVPGRNGLSFDVLGLFGLLTLVIGVVLVLVGLSRTFVPAIKLPERILSFTIEQECFALALTVFLWTFALITEDGVKIGIHLAWLSAVVAAVGAVLAMRDQPSASFAAPSRPTSF
jgi:vacuolar-type H+-ATPase subunit I/STV1